jgi:hypothetical protein
MHLLLQALELGVHVLHRDRRMAPGVRIGDRLLHGGQVHVRLAAGELAADLVADRVGQLVLVQLDLRGRRGGAVLRMCDASQQQLAKRQPTQSCHALPPSSTEPTC